MVLVLTSAFVRSAVEAEIGRPCVTTRQRQSTQINISMVMVKYLLQHTLSEWSWFSIPVRTNTLHTVKVLGKHPLTLILSGDEKGPEPFSVDHTLVINATSERSGSGRNRGMVCTCERSCDSSGVGFS